VQSTACGRSRRGGAAADGVEDDEEALEPGAVAGELADAVEHEVDAAAGLVEEGANEGVVAAADGLVDLAAAPCKANKA
jgi:hypothetical protein